MFIKDKNVKRCTNAFVVISDSYLYDKIGRCTLRWQLYPSENNVRVVLDLKNWIKVHGRLESIFCDGRAGYQRYGKIIHWGRYLEISNFSETISSNVRKMGDTLFIFQNLLSCGHSFWDTLITKGNRLSRLMHTAPTHEDRVGSVFYRSMVRTGLLTMSDDSSGRKTLAEMIRYQ